MADESFPSSMPLPSPKLSFSFNGCRTKRKMRARAWARAWGMGDGINGNPDSPGPWILHDFLQQFRKGRIFSRPAPSRMIRGVAPDKSTILEGGDSSNAGQASRKRSTFPWNSFRSTLGSPQYGSPEGFALVETRGLPTCLSHCCKKGCRGHRSATFPDAPTRSAGSSERASRRTVSGPGHDSFSSDSIPLGIWRARRRTQLRSGISTGMPFSEDLCLSLNTRSRAASWRARQDRP